MTRREGGKQKWEKRRHFTHTKIKQNEKQILIRTAMK